MVEGNIMEKEIKQKMEKRIGELKQSLAQTEADINQAMNQCPFIANLRNTKTSLQGGLLELEIQLKSYKEEKK